MYPFIETIRIEQGKVHNLSYHQERMRRTYQAVWGLDLPFDLESVLHPESYQECTKCRVVYTDNQIDVEYAPYQIRPVRLLRLVYSDTIDYRYKSTDRQCLNELFALREEADDVLIVRKGLLTDTSICNVALWNGEAWITPAHPLLDGTMRASLLDSGQIIAGNIRVEDLPSYSHIRLFNAMIDFGAVEISQRI